jgi:hypothetical protein
VVQIESRHDPPLSVTNKASTLFFPHEYESNTADWKGSQRSCLSLQTQTKPSNGSSIMNLGRPVLCATVVILCSFSFPVRGQGGKVPGRLRARDLTEGEPTEQKNEWSSPETLTWTLEDRIDGEMFLNFFAQSALSMSMPNNDIGGPPRYESCVSPDIPAFEIDESVDIGDVLYHLGGRAESCGKDCYKVKDNGDDPPFDPELGDTLQFAYRPVTNKTFTFRAKVCGVDCGPETFGPDGMGRCGLMGLMVRESIDPLSKFVFVAFQPHAQVDWAYRSQFGDLVSSDADGSPDDKDCLWMTVTRNGGTFSLQYEAVGDNSCDVCADCPDVAGVRPPLIHVEMTKTVLVGLAVSTPVSIPDDGSDFYRSGSEAVFQSVELVIGGSDV